MISLGRSAIRSTVVMLALLTLVVAGAATVTAKAAMAAGTLTNTTGNTVTVQPPSPPIMGKVGVPLSVQLLATDSDPSQTLTWSATGLPSWARFNAATGVLSGTPTAAGAFTLTVTATDTTGARGSATVTISISPASTVTVTNPGAQTAVVDVTVQLQMTATDSDPTQAITWSATGLPAGMTISPSSGLISGFPRIVGPNSVTVTATDGNGATGTVSFTFTISGEENIVDVAVPGLQSGVVGTAVFLQLSATDSAPGQTLTWSASRLPPGLSINTTSGLISGTPTASGTFVTTASATDTTGASGSALIIWEIASNPLLTVTNPGPQAGTVGTAVSLQLAETGFQAPAWSATGLPPGLTINSSTGLISGTPTTAGNFSVTATVTASTGATGSANFTFTINPAGGTCHIAYTRNSEWPGGWTAQVVINNTGTTTINGWSLTFTFPGDQKITSNFNGGFSQTGENVTLTNASYNGTIVPGASITDGFMGTWTSNDTNPASFAVNGITCT